MQEKNKLVRLSWDSKSFGYEVGSINLHNITATRLQKLKEKARKSGFKVIYLRVDPTDWQSMGSAQESGGTLYDEKTRYVCQNKTIPTVDNRIESYPAHLPAGPLHSLALQSGICSRFFLDKRFVNDEFRKLYISWIDQSVDRSRSREVLVHRGMANDYTGLITLEVLKNGRLNIGLLAVDEQVRGQGIGNKLLNAAVQRSAIWHCNGIQVVTQQANIPACQFYERNGFRIESIRQIYHLWL